MTSPQVDDTSCTEALDLASADPTDVPLEAIDMSQARLYETGRHTGYFERLRREDPVHYCPASPHGPYWSVTTFADVDRVERNPELFSSADGIMIFDAHPQSRFQSTGFIMMDGPEHQHQREAVQPVVAPPNLTHLEPIIRRHAAMILDELPTRTSFDWVQRVSVELTTNMLATMFDYPWESRHDLVEFTELATAEGDQLAAMNLSGRDKERRLLEFAQTFIELREQRTGTTSDRLDFITQLANQEHTRDHDFVTYMGNVGLLVIGGNDTTRNTMSGSVLALNEFPDQYDLLRRTPSLLPKMVDEAIRWQTPLAHMRRTATQTTQLGGKTINQGDKIVLWYISANRDELAIDRPNEFIINRNNAKKHLSFGLGVHYCIGARLAKLQLMVLWEEILRRFHTIEVTGEPTRVSSCFAHGISELPVKLHPK